MRFDEEPDDDPHGRCRHEITQLRARLAEVEASRDRTNALALTMAAKAKEAVECFESERDQARLDAGIWERRVAEAAETIGALEFSAEKDAEVAERYIRELETRNRELAAELKRAAR